MNAFPWFGHACRAIHSSNSTAPAGSKATEWGGTRVGPFIRREIRFRRASVGAARWSSILDEWPQRSAQVSIRHGFVVSARLTTKTIFVWKRDIAQCKKIRDIDLDHKKMKENSKNK